MFSFEYGEEEEEYEEELFFYDNLTPIERLTEFVIHSDIPVQRVSTLQRLSSIAREVGFNDTCDQILPIMEQLSTDQEFSIRMVTAEQLVPIAEFLQEYDDQGISYVENRVIPLCIDLAQDNTTEVREAAVHSFIVCVKMLPLHQLEGAVLPVLSQFASSSIDEDLRSLSMTIVDQLAESLDADVLLHNCLPHVLDLADDPIFRVRKAVVGNLQGLSRHIAPVDAEAQVLPLFQALAQDEIWGVRKAACEAIVGLCECYPVEVRTAQLQAIFVDFLNDQSRWVRSSAHEHLGHFISLLAEDKHSIDARLVKQFLDMAGSGATLHTDADTPVMCAFNFPAVLWSLGAERWEELRPSYEALCKDMQWKVRRTLAFSIHEFAGILGPEISEKQLLPAFDMFIRDLDEVRVGCVTHLADFVSKLNGSAREEVIPLIQGVEEDSANNWRMRELLAKQIAAFCVQFAAPSLAEVIVPMWRRLLQDPVSSVRVAACAATATVLTVVDRDALVSELAMLANSSAHRQRQVYLACAPAFVHVLNAAKFEEAVLPVLSTLAQDPVANVRLKLAQLLAGWATAGAATAASQIKEMLELLSRDTDSDVQYNALVGLESVKEHLQAAGQGSSHGNNENNGPSSSSSSSSSSDDPVVPALKVNTRKEDTVAGHVQSPRTAELANQEDQTNHRSPREALLAAGDAGGTGSVDSDAESEATLSDYDEDEDSDEAEAVFSDEENH